jgi:hypothetical protein
MGTYTDKKENQVFLIYKEIQSGAVAKSQTGAAAVFFNFRGFSEFIVK